MATAQNSMEMSSRQWGAMISAFLLVNGAVFYLASMFFPTMVVLGNHVLSPLIALGLSAALLAAIDVVATPLIEKVSAMQNWQLSMMHWMALYFVINTAAIWVMGRFAESIGLGISGWVVAVVLGLILDILQGGVVKMVMDKVK